MTDHRVKAFTCISILLTISFLFSTAIAAEPAVTAGVIAKETAESMQEFYELRVYRIESQQKQEVVSNYLEKALLPALKRMSLDRIGVFTVMDKPEDLSIYVLIPYPNLDIFASVNDKLFADKTFMGAASDYFKYDDKADAPYIRIESRLMKAFKGIPIIEMPLQSKARSPRMFEMRTYESPNEEKAMLKVDMFNSGRFRLCEIQNLPRYFSVRRSLVMTCRT